MRRIRNMRLLGFHQRPIGPELRKWLMPALWLAVIALAIVMWSTYDRYVTAHRLGDELYVSWTALERGLDQEALIILPMTGLIRGGADHGLVDNALEAHSRYLAARGPYEKFKSGEVLYSVCPELVARAEEVSGSRRSQRLERMFTDMEKEQRELFYHIERYNSAIEELDEFSEGFAGELFASLAWGRGVLPGPFRAGPQASELRLENLEHSVQ